MFQGAPGLSVEWPSVLYPALLPQYEGVSAEKPAEPQTSLETQKDADATGKASGVRRAFICTGRPVVKCRFLTASFVFLLRKKRENQREKVRRRRLMRVERVTGRRKMRQCLHGREEEEEMDLETTGR